MAPLSSLVYLGRGGVGRSSMHRVVSSATTSLGGVPGRLISSEDNPIEPRLFTEVHFWPLPPLFATEDSLPRNRQLLANQHRSANMTAAV